MKIKHFRVDKLHNIYDYDVSFNDDVTFLYGSNGCGKTTILNLITYIITGHVFKLLEFTFRNIELTYCDGNDIKNISIEKPDEASLKVQYNGKSHSIKPREFHNEVYFDSDSVIRNELPESMYFKYYPWLREIKTSFNFVFLPLSRNNNTLANLYDKRYESSRYILPREYESKWSSSHESSLNLVKSMINENYTQISTKINEINVDFRNKMFMSFFHFNQDDTFSEDILRNGKRDKEFDKSKGKVLKTFNDIGILTPEFTKEIDSFYDKWKLSVDYYNKAMDGKAELKEISSYLSNIVSNYARIKQILEITDLADKMDNQKEITLHPINTFLELINGFFSQGECAKEIGIDKKGQIYFVTPNCSTPIDIEKLSSGEQQLLIFFAYLIFGLKDQDQGIFIVDEPELSLHLAWQRKYVESILNINNKVQLIFATHSPEIVGKYRDKRIKLVPMNNNCSSAGGQ